MPGIRESITQQLGLEPDNPDTKYMVNTLIRGYSDSHDGHVSPDSIVNDVLTVAHNIVDNLPNVAYGYDFAHEVLECGKAREEDAIQALGGNAADECLPDHYADTVGYWSSAIFDVAQNIYEQEAFGNGIDGYRDFVSELPYQNIREVATGLDEERETVRFIARYGNADDFHDYMMDARPNDNDLDDVESAEMTDREHLSYPLDTGDAGVTTHGIPHDLSNRIFEAITTYATSHDTDNHVFESAENKGENLHFDRDSLMHGLSAIHYEHTMSDDEKVMLQDTYIERHLENAVPYEFDRVVRNDHIENKFEALSTSLNSIHDAREHGIENYNALMERLDGQSNPDQLSAKEFGDMVKDSFSDTFSQSGMETRYVEIDPQYNTLDITASKDPTTGQTIYVSIPAEELTSIYNEYNDFHTQDVQDRIERAIEGDYGVSKITTDFYPHPHESLESNSTETTYNFHVPGETDVHVTKQTDENGDVHFSIDSPKEYLDSFFDVSAIPYREDISPERFNEIEEKVEAKISSEEHYSVIGDTTCRVDLTPLSDSDKGLVMHVMSTGEITEDDLPTFVSVIDDRDLTARQGSAVADNIHLGLSEDGASLIANPAFNPNDIADMGEEIRNGTSIETMSICIDNYLDNHQRHAVETAAEHGVNADTLDLIVSQGYDAEQLSNIFTSLEGNNFADRIVEYVKPEQSISEIHIILDGLENGFSNEQMDMLTAPLTMESDDPDHSDSRFGTPKDIMQRMEDIDNGFKNGLSLDQISQSLSPDYDVYQAENIIEGYEHGLSDDQVGRYADSSFDLLSMRTIREATEQGLSEDKLDMIANPDFDSDQMETVADGFESYGLSVDQAQIYADPDLGIHQMHEIIQGFRDDLSADQVLVYASTDFSADKMHEIRIGIEEGLSIDQVEQYADPKYDARQMEAIRTGIEDGLTPDQIDKYKDESHSGYAMEEIRTAIEEHAPEDRINLYASGFDGYQIAELRRADDHGVSQEQFDFLAKPDINAGVMHEITKEFDGGLSLEQMEPYVHTNYSTYQIDQIFDGMKAGLDQDMIQLYANPDFVSSQMAEIRTGLENGLTGEQVELYADPAISAAPALTGTVAETAPGNQMLELRLGLEHGLDADQIQIMKDSGFTANPLYENQLEQLRIGMEHGLSNEQAQSFPSDDLHGSVRDNRVKMEISNNRELIENAHIDTSYMSTGQKEVITDAIAEGMDTKEIQLFAHQDLSVDEMRNIKEFAGTELGQQYADMGLSADNAVSLAKALDAHMDEKQIEVRMDVQTNRLSNAQEHELDYAIEHGMNAHDAQFLVDLNLPGFYDPDKGDFFEGMHTDNKMEQASLGLLHGLSHDEVSMYADKSMSSDAMCLFREALEAGKGLESVENVYHEIKDSDTNPFLTDVREQLRAIPEEPKNVQIDTPIKLQDDNVLVISITGNFDDGFDVKMHPVNDNGEIMRDIDVKTRGWEHCESQSQAVDHAEYYHTLSEDRSDDAFSWELKAALRDSGYDETDLYKDSLEKLQDILENNDKDMEIGNDMDDDSTFADPVE